MSTVQEWALPRCDVFVVSSLDRVAETRCWRGGERGGDQVESQIFEFFFGVSKNEAQLTIPNKNFGKS